MAYVFADGRGKGEIAAQLVDYAGILQVDGYVAYKPDRRIGSPGRTADWPRCALGGEIIPKPVAEKICYRLLSRPYDLRSSFLDCGE